MRRVRLSAVLLSTAFSLGVAPLLADGVAYRVKDIRTVPPEEGGGSVNVSILGPLGSSALVGIGAWSQGQEPWLTDGTAAGTRLLVDLAPGGSSGPGMLARLGGRILFTAETPALGRELWATDGTTAGTLLLADIRTGRESSDPRLVGVLSGIAYFSAQDATHGRELWKSDGTPAGTRMVEDVRPGAHGGLDCAERGGVYHNRVYFCADGGSHGAELWRTDGTANGTFEVADLVPGSAGSMPADFEPAIGYLFFAAEDSAHGRELRVTEGTADTTRLVRDVNPGPADSKISMMGALPNRLIFSAADGVHGEEPWKSDGTEAGTRLVKDLRPGAEGSTGYPLDPYDTAVLGGRVFFTAFESEFVARPFVSDGTAAGTLALEQSGGGSSYRRIGSEVWYSGGTGAGYDGLWKSDGTPSGTQLFAVMPPREYSSEGDFVPVGGGAVFYFYWDDDFRFSTTELWFSDGTAAGTHEVVDFGAPRAQSVPRAIGAREGGIVFGALPDGSASPYRTHLFRSDGTEAGTYEMAPELLQPDQVVELPDGEALVALMYADQGLWRTDGDLLSPLPSGIRYHPALTRLGDEVFFAGWDAAAGRELWKTDGTPAGTSRVADLRSGPDDSDPHDLTAALDRVWFGLGSWWSDPGSIWESAGTAASTIEHVLGVQIHTYDDPNSIHELDPAAGTLVFRAGDAIWRLAAGSGELEQIRQLEGNTYGTFPMTVLDGAAYFLDADGNRPCALFRSLGTAQQTTLVKNVGCQSDVWSTGLPEEMVAFAGRVWFQGCNSATGCELWASDGTGPGTAPLADLAPGGFSTMPALLTPIGDRLYFRACTPAAGCEPWVTDGSRAGTHRIADIWPGPASSLAVAYAGFTRSGRLLYFPADDGTGSELWAMPMEIFYDGFETGDVSRWDPPTPP